MIASVIIERAHAIITKLRKPGHGQMLEEQRWTLMQVLQHLQVRTGTAQINQDLQ